MGRSRLSVTAVVGGSMAAILGLGIGRMAAAQPALAEYSPPSLTTPLRTTFVDGDALAVRHIPQGLTRPVFDNPAPGLDKIELHITTLNPQMTLHAPHHHAWEELCLVREGEVQVSINGLKHRAGPGDLAFFASHDAHSIENDSDKPATYVVMNICSPQARTISDKAVAESGATGLLPSSVFDCNGVPATPNATGSTALIFASPTKTFARLSSQITTLNVGQSSQGITSDWENELLFVKSGRLEVAIHGISCRSGEGSLLYCGPNEKQTLKNIGSTPAVYQTICFVSAPTKVD